MNLSLVPGTVLIALLCASMLVLFVSEPLVKLVNREQDWKPEKPDVYKRQVYARGLAAQEDQNISLEHALLQLRYARCAHQVHFSVHPSVVMVAYLSLCEMEVANLTRCV